MLSLYPKNDMLKPKGYEIRLGSLILSSLAINLLSLALPIMTLQVYDRILPNPLSGTLPVLIAGVLVAIVLETLLRLARGYVISWNGAAYEHRLSCEAMEHLLESDLAELNQYGVGDQLHRMSATGKLKEFYNGYAHITLFEMIFVPIFLGVTFYVAGYLVLIPLTILVLFSVVSLYQGRKLRGALKERDAVDDERYNFLIKGLEGIHTLKSLALEDVMTRKHEHAQEQSTIANYNVTGLASGIFNTSAVFSHLMVSVVIAGGALFVLNGSITTGALIATILLSGRMMQPIQRGLGLWAKYQDYTLARKKVEELFALSRQEVTSPKTPEIREGSLKLNEMSFHYPQQDEHLIQNAQLTLEHGETVLLNGKHGSAKTTLLELMAGMYHPTSGEVLIDNQNTRDFAPETLIRHVGYVQSEGLIFNGSIRDNMTCFGQVPEQQVSEIAELLKVNRDVARLPAGFDTRLNGDGIDKIPPGLKQRIAIVRVLSSKPRLILFDNANKALDREGYQLVFNLLARLKGKATMVLVSDDFNICTLADRSLRLQDGKLEEVPHTIGKNNLHLYQELRL